MSIKKIRIGNDIAVSWTLTRTDGAPNPIDQAVKLDVMLQNVVTQHVFNPAVTAAGNVLNIQFTAAMQRPGETGIYNIIASYQFADDSIEGGKSTTTVDYLGVFMLVPHSKMEGGTNDDVTVITLESDVTVGGSNSGGGLTQSQVKWLGLGIALANGAESLPEGINANYNAILNHNHDLKYAPLSHTHSGYAPSSHTHSDYALTAHTHADYLAKPTVEGSEGQVLTKTPSGQEWKTPTAGGGVAVVNNLNSDSTTDALSAAQGKELKRLIDEKQVSGGGLTIEQATLLGTADELLTEAKTLPTAVNELKAANDRLGQEIGNILNEGNNIQIVVSEESKTEKIDTLTGNSAANYSAYTVGCGTAMSSDVNIKRLAVSCRANTECKFSIYSSEKRYPTDTSNFSRIYTKVSEIGICIANSNNIAELLLDNTITLTAGNIVIASAKTKLIGYKSYEGASGEIYAYNVDAFSAENGSTFIALPTTEVATPRPLYVLEYETENITVSKSLKTILDGLNTDTEVLKNTQGQHTEQLVNISKQIGNIGTESTLKELFENRTIINKYFVLLSDDLTRDILSVAPKLIENGIYPAFGIRADVIPASITWDEIRQLQDMGFEMAFHGMTHSDFPAGSSPTKDDVMAAQIAEFKALCNDNNVYIKGYLGPNHYQLPVSCRKDFEWARSAYGATTYGGGNRLSTVFANCIVMSAEITTADQDISTFKAFSDGVLDNQYITPMCHTQNLVANIDKYIELFNKWKSDGLVCIRPCDAVRQSLWDSGSIGQNSTIDIQAGTTIGDYFVVAKNGSVKTNQINQNL